MSLGRGTVLAFAAVAGLAVVLAGLWQWIGRAHVDRERRTALDAGRHHLAGLADLRQTSIARWAAHFRDDARFVARFPTVRELCASDGAERRHAEEHVAEVLDEYVGHADVQTVAVVDVAGEVLVLRGHDSAEVRTIVRAATRQALDGGSLIDVVPFGAEGALVVWASPIEPVASGRPTAALVGTTAPEGTLFPIVRTADGSSTETILVVKRGSEIAFASPLRGDASGTSSAPAAGRAPFSVRFPAADGPDPARLSLAAGGSGLFTDYRGVRVLAEARRVPGTGWGIVVKADESEILAETRANLRRQLLILTCALLAVAVVATGAVRLARAKHAAALARSEARFAHLLDDADDAIFVAGADGTILRANRRAAEMYGRPIPGLLGMRAADLRTAAARESCQDDFQRALRVGRAVWQTTDVRADGTEFTVEASARAIDDPGGPQLVVVVRDVSARAAAERALRESEALARARADETATLLDVVPVAVVFAHDRDCTSVTGNRMALDLLGARSQAEFQAGTMRYLQGADLWVTHGRRSLERGDAPLRAAAKDGTRFDGLEIDIRFPGGELRSFVGNVAPIPGPGGAPRGAILAGIDVTEHRRARRAMQVLSRAIEQTPSAVIITDLAGTIEYVNPAFTEITGYAAGEAVGKNPRFLGAQATPRETYADLWATISSGRVWRGELRNRRSDGAEIRVSTVIAPIHDEDGTIRQFVAIQDDETARRTTEEALHAAERDLIQAQKMEAVGRLAGGVAHDFNNMLAIIVGYAELASGSIGPDSPVRAALAEILTAAERAEGLTRQLLAFSRKQVTEPRLVDASELVRDILKMLKRLIGEDVELVPALDPDAGTIHADPGQIEQVLFNLAVNARDAMPRGGTLTIETSRVQVPEASASPAAPAGDWVRFRVTDTGCGIPAEIRERVFEPFFTTKERGKGTGLGLSTVHGIVLQAGGTVRFESEVGKGTTFDIYLPRVSAAAAEAVDMPPPPAAASPLRILVVEDEPQVRAMTCAMLEGLGHSVLAADGGADADAVLARAPVVPELLLTDVIMPQESGPQLAERLRARIPGLRVLFMSGYTDDALVRGGELPPGMHLLRKPFSFDALARAVREVAAAPG